MNGDPLRRNSPVADLVDALVEAAGEAIRSQEAALTSGAGDLTNLTIPLDVANNGAVVDSRCTVERSGVHRSPRRIQ
jgi:hypothetical protein